MDILDKINNKHIEGYLMVNKKIIFEGAIYHITQRAPGREILFVDEGDYLYFLKLLKEVTKKFNLEIFSFALLPNHLHLLLRIRQKNLSLAMKNLFERYADYFNKKYKRKGHVFCGRYRASLCSGENYFLAISIYIHLNPYYARLCRTFKDYRWTSLQLYTGKGKETFINYRETLSLLDLNIENARKKYSEILNERAKVKATVFLDFSSIKKSLRGIAEEVKKAIGGEKKLQKLYELIEEFREKKKVIKEEDKKARKYLIEQLLANGYSSGEITRMLTIHRMTFYRVMNSNVTK